MGFMDGLKKLTQPYDDEDDFFEGADLSLKPQPKPEAPKAPVTAAQMAFESSFADNSVAPAQEETQPRRPAGEGGSLLGNLGLKRPGGVKPRGRAGTVNVGGRETSVMLFSPKTFDEAGELLGYLQQELTVVMTLEGLPAETARRLLDFLSGIAFALGGKITPVSTKTYFVTPANVDILGAQQAEQPESSAHYF